MNYQTATLPKDLIDLNQLNPTQIENILNRAESFKEVSERDIKKVPTLRGKLVVLFFHENSTRTKLSFEIAAKRLSADTIALAASGSSMAKGETLLDTAKNLEAMNPDAIIIRHGASGVPQFLGDRLSCPILNAGDGSHAHPTQALLDMLTIKEHKGQLSGLKVTIIGDIAHSRVARSNIIGLTKMGADVHICAPPSMLPAELEKAYPVTVHKKPESALENSDVVMALRIQLERQGGIIFPGAREYAKVYGLNKQRMTLAKKDAIILHPGPVNQGVELSPDIYQSPQSLILPQVTNGVAVRMALLYLLIDNSEKNDKSSTKVNNE